MARRTAFDKCFTRELGRYDCEDEEKRVERELEQVDGLNLRLRSALQQVEGLNIPHMEADVARALKLAKNVKVRLRALDRTNRATENLPRVYDRRERTSALNRLRRRLRLYLAEFDSLNNIISSTEYSERDVDSMRTMADRLRELGQVMDRDQGQELDDIELDLTRPGRVLFWMFTLYLLFVCAMGVYAIRLEMSEDY